MRCSSKFNSDDEVHERTEDMGRPYLAIDKAMEKAIQKAVHCRGQPILPSLSYPVFMVVPSLTMDSDSGVTNIPEEGFEVSQFHSQDEMGRVVFGFQGPDQSRMEARSLDGSVRGSYSYIDPYGHIVKMQYWDDGTGFHVAGNALPAEGSPPYTPEVAAAREQHLKIYQQTLAAAQKLMQQSDESAYADSPNNDPSLGISKFEDFTQFHKVHQDNSLFGDDKESISLENPELFGNHYTYHEDVSKDEKKPGKEEVEGEVELGEDIGPDEDIEEESYDNDQTEVDRHKFNQGYDRIKKYGNDHDEIVLRLKHSISNNEKVEEGLQDEYEDEKQIAEEDHKDKDTVEEQNIDKMEDEEKNGAEGHDNADKIKENIDSHDNNDELDSEDHYNPQTSENRNSEVSLVAHPLKPLMTGVTNIKSNEDYDKTEDQTSDKSNTKIKMVSPTVKRRGFFYHFQHTIPRPTERIDEAVEKGLKSAAAIKIPSSAVHDSHLSPYHFMNSHLFPFPQL